MPVEEVNLIVTDMHPRITGVGSTIRTLAPHIDSLESLTLVSARMLPGVRSIGVLRAILACVQPPRARPFRIWHARRNKEMLVGLAVKYLLRARIRVVMTSCALRRHSWFPRQLLSAMDAIIATSDEAASFVESVTATIPHGVDCDRFRPATDRNAAWKALGIRGDHGISFVGRIRPEKGVDLFVDAMIRVLPKYPGFTACIVGRTTLGCEPFRRQLAARIDQAGLSDRFAWLGEVDYEKMPHFHSAMSLCVAPARYEGYGLVPLEAMACSVPVIASETGCYRDAIIPGVTGSLVPCDDLDALTLALDELLAVPNKLPIMGKAGRRIVESRYSAKVEAARIVDVYRDLWAKAT